MEGRDERSHEARRDHNNHDTGRSDNVHDLAAVGFIILLVAQRDARDDLTVDVVGRQVRSFR